MGYGGKYTQVKEAVQELLRVRQEVFMPLIHRVGEAQEDFGHALAKVYYSPIIRFKAFCSFFSIPSAHDFPLGFPVLFRVLLPALP